MKWSEDKVAPYVTQKFTGVQGAYWVGRKKHCVSELDCSGAALLLPPANLVYNCFRAPAVGWAWSWGWWYKNEQNREDPGPCAA